MSGSFADFCERTGLRNSLLVVAPHPDDETIGCGGLIAFAASAGMRTKIVVVTDGAASHPNSLAWPPHRLAERRRLETAVALEVLGVEEQPEFLDLPDGKTGSVAGDVTDDARRRMESCVAQWRPDVVLTTWRREPHCDHRFAYALARDALRSTSTPAILVEYIVWTYFIGELGDQPQAGESVSFRLDIDPVRLRKRNALAAHRTQPGRIVRDDATGFCLTPAQLAGMTGGEEQYELSCAAIR